MNEADTYIYYNKIIIGNVVILNDKMVYEGLYP